MELAKVDSAGVNVCIGPDEVLKKQDHHLTAESPLWVHTLARGQDPLQAQIHPGFEFGMVLRGSMERHWGGFARSLAPGEVWLCSTWEPHGWQSTGPVVEDVVLLFLPEFLGEEQFGDHSWLTLFTAAPAFRPGLLPRDARADMLHLGREMQKEIIGGRPFWQTAVRAQLLLALLALRRAWERPLADQGPSSTNTGDLQRVMPALSLLGSSGGDRVSLAEAANACALSRARFCAIFRSTMGMGFGQFSRRSRLGRVAEILASTDLSLEAIARQAGFVDGSHLNRAFAKHYGCSPGAYRARAQAQSA